MVRPGDRSLPLLPSRPRSFSAPAKGTEPTPARRCANPQGRASAWQHGRAVVVRRDQPGAVTLLQHPGRVHHAVAGDLGLAGEPDAGLAHRDRGVLAQEADGPQLVDGRAALEEGGEALGHALADLLPGLAVDAGHDHGGVLRVIRDEGVGVASVPGLVVAFQDALNGGHVVRSGLGHSSLLIARVPMACDRLTDTYRRRTRNSSPRAAALSRPTPP